MDDVKKDPIMAPVMAALRGELDAQRLRADTAEAERDALKDEVGQAKGEYDRAVNKLAAAEQRIAKMAKVLTDIRQSCELSHLRDSQIDAALNQKSEGESHAD